MSKKIEKCKNMLDRFRFELLANKDIKNNSLKTFLITKKDGSQRYFKALQCEFDEETGEATFYKVGQMLSGTRFTKVINVEILKDIK